MIEPFGYFQFDLRLDAWVLNRDSNKGVAFYTAPPKKEWVGLTGDEVQNLTHRKISPWMWLLLKEFETKLKEKNSG